MATESALSTLSRYEALFELASEVNSSTDMEQVGQVFVRRLKYVADVFSWRYVSLEPEKSAIVVDGYRGRATLKQVRADELCEVELELWSGKKARVLEGAELERAQQVLPEQFRKSTIVQIYVCTRFGPAGLQCMLLYSKVRSPFNELDLRFLTLASGIFHDKVYLLWEQKKRRDLELAYLQQEITLRQSEKLATLGRLSAGMAHELNNPAAAAQRGAQQLREEIDRLARAERRLGGADLTAEHVRVLEELAAQARDRAGTPDSLDAVARSDVESEIGTWLEEHGVADPWQVAPALVTMGLTSTELAELAQRLGDDRLPAILAAVTSTYATQALVSEIREGTARVSEIVRALKSYTYMDQAPVQAVDVHEGLNDTLVMLRSKLKDGVVIRREYAADLPRIEAFGTELNQVWTNIVDNAVTAMQGRGTLTLKTFRRDPWVVVQIIDDGVGIAPDVQPKVFDPFFTTKPPGEGTGLGLNISHHIVVERHGGEIEVRSKPGETCFEVRLPFKATEGAA